MKTAITISAGTCLASLPLWGITTPLGLNPGDTFHYLTVTTSTINATSNDRSVYDTLVSGDATSNGLNTIEGQPVSWSALASMDGGTSAISIFNPSVGIYLLDGTKVADNGADLWGGPSVSLDAPVNLAMDEGTYSGNVWAGTNNEGGTFKGLGESAISVSYGDTTSTGQDWIQRSTQSKNTLYRLYSFSSAITVVPEPQQVATGLFAGFVAIVATWMRRRKAAK